MSKQQCEICGEMKSQQEMSKSYKHRCKACVAEMTRDQRHAAKAIEERFGPGSGAHIPEGAGPKTALPKRDNDTLTYMATAFLQAILSNPNLSNPLALTADCIVVYARNAKTAAKALMKILEIEEA